METQSQTAVIVGRFQVPYLHPGHVWLIARARQLFKEVIIILGESPERDEKNPYTPLQRADIIEKVFGTMKFHVIYDQPGQDEIWCDNLDKILRYIKDPVLVHSRDSFKGHYFGRHPLFEIPELPGYSGTKLREELKNDNGGTAQSGSGQSQ